jgi:hypothetical protein
MPMGRSSWLAVGVLVLGAAAVTAVELVPVRGSDKKFTTTMDATLKGKPVKLILTGTALRQKLFLNVYAVGSYLLEGVRIGSPEELAATDNLKRLHLVMEREVDGRDMAEAFRKAIRQNYPEPIFADEVNRLVQALQSDTIAKDDHIYLTHVPGVGLHCNLAGKREDMIRNPNFSRAVWDIYLGKNNLGEGIKRGLVSRLVGR